jgi:cytoskeletal protein RodZ
MAPVAAVAAAPAVSAVPPIQLQAAPPPAKSKAPLVIGLFAVVAIAGGAGAFFALKPAPTPPPTGTESTTKDTGSTGATAAPTTAPTPTQAAAPTADTAKAADTGTPQAATAPLPGKTPDAKPDKTPEPPKTPDKTPEPPKTPDKAPEPPKPDTGGSGGKEFDRAAAMSALGASSGAARGCKKDDGPTGTARVKITFAPNGSVTSSSVEGPPFAGTPVGGCIAGAFRGAHVPAFDGGPVTVTKSVSIN